MNDFEKAVSLLPKEGRIVHQVTIELTPVGGVMVSGGGVDIAKELFMSLFGNDTLTRIQKCLNDATFQASGIIQKTRNAGPLIDVVELKRQAGEKSP